MAEFLLRAHAAPVDPGEFRAARGGDAHVEFLAQVVINGLFVSKGHRPQDRLTLVLERSRDFSRALTLAGETLGSIGAMTEGAILDMIAAALEEGAGLGKEATATTRAGVVVSTTSFERLVKTRLAAGLEVFLLEPGGQDLRETPCAEDAVFLLTDHVPMPKNLRKGLLRQGAKALSLGPVMLHASQCIVLVQNEYDRLYSGR